MQAHPLTKLFPPMAEADYAALKASIAANGLREPIKTYQGAIVDGVHRQRACEETGVPPRYEEWNGQGLLIDYVYDLNSNRRQLTRDQRAAVRAEYAIERSKEAKKLKSEGGKKGGKQSGESRFMKTKDESNSTHPSASNKRANQSRDSAAQQSGVGSTKMQEAINLKKKAPELHEKVKQGELKHSQAKQILRNQEKRAELEARAQAAPPSTASSWCIRCGDVLEELAKIETGSVALIFADPPYNIGIDYGEGTKADLLPEEQFVAWCRQWIGHCHRALRADGTFWLLIGDEYADYLGLELRQAGFHRRAWVKWYETFGVCNSAGKNFSRCSRHLFYCVKDRGQFTFHPEAVTRPSDRQTKYEDKRANPEGKVWDDVWNIPRLVGTAAERIPDFPTQLPLDLLTPIVGCSSHPGELVLDPFSGSATTGAAALQLGRRYLGIEKQTKFAHLSELRLKGIRAHEAESA